MASFYKFKVILMGPAAVGKTSLMYQFIHGKFQHSYMATIGVDFLGKSLTVEGNDCRLTIWDVAGQASFKSMRRTFYNGTNGALLIFDLTREETFGEIGTWYEEMMESLKSPVPFILIGNKLDLLEEKGRVIEKKKAEGFARLNNSQYIETSAKTGENVEEAFLELTRKMILP